MNILFLNKLRVREIEDVLEKHGDLFRGKRVLEIGGGTGVQAEFLSEIAQEVVSLEIAESNYRDSANHHIVMYDGRHIPFPDSSFDIVYSSNVLEHIAHRDDFQKELMRVLKPEGHAIHSMPTQWWKLRDILENMLLFLPTFAWHLHKKIRGVNVPSSSVLPYVLGDRHGEFGNTLTEVYYFMPRTWLVHFRRQEWKVLEDYGGGLFYTGRLIFGQKLSWPARRLLARFFGSSVHVYHLQKV